MLKNKISEEELINKIGDYNIFQKYFGSFDLSSCYPSIFREDNHPSTGFYLNSKGRIIYNDFAINEQLTSVQFVQKLFGLNYFEALQKILADFESPEDDGELPNVKKVLKEKSPKRIDIIVRNMNEQELSYWKEYSITEKELLENHVYGIKELRFNYYLIENKENNLRFAYVIKYKNKEYLKIYSPLDKERKWLGNVKGAILFGYDELPYKSDTLIITKSQKDRLIFKKYFTDVVAVQSEAKNSVTETDAKYFSSMYKNIYINFDIDEQKKNKKQTMRVGIESATEIANKFGWKTLFIPEICYSKYGVKDVADMVKTWGLKAMDRWLKNEKLI